MTSSPPPGRQADGASDRRWIVLSEAGCYATMGRARDPSDEEVQRAEDGLRAQGLGGWLAVMSHTEFVEAMPTVVEVRRLGSPSVDFAEAARRFESLIMHRRQTLEGGL